MNQQIQKIKEKFLAGKPITKEDVTFAQNHIEDDEDLFMTYFFMSRVYLDKKEFDAVTYCVLKCYELNEKHHFDLDFKIKDFVEARSDFMEEAILKTRKKILPLSILFGVIVLVLVWLIMAHGELTGFILGFIAMNLISIYFQKVGSEKTIRSFKKKQYQAVEGFLDEQDREFANRH